MLLGPTPIDTMRCRSNSSDASSVRKDEANDPDGDDTSPSDIDKDPSENRGYTQKVICDRYDVHPFSIFVRGSSGIPGW